MQQQSGRMSFAHCPLRQPCRPCSSYSSPPRVAASSRRIQTRMPSGAAAARSLQLRRRLAPPRAAVDSEEDDYELERLQTWPRMAYGLSIHRMLHTLAARNPGYLFQWRAFAERNKLDWRAVTTDEDEGLLAGAWLSLVRRICAEYMFSRHLVRSKRR